MMNQNFKSIRLLALAGAAAGLSLVAVQPAFADEEKAESKEMTKGEKELAKMLEGREAGEPVRCIRNRPNPRLKVIDKTAYIYGSGKTIYVQYTANPKRIDRDDVLVTRQFNASELCRMDVINTREPVNGMMTGVVQFEDFIPYTKVEEEKS